MNRFAVEPSLLWVPWQRKGIESADCAPVGNDRQNGASTEYRAPLRILPQTLVENLHSAENQKTDPASQDRSFDGGGGGIISVAGAHEISSSLCRGTTSRLRSNPAFEWRRGWDYLSRSAPEISASRCRGTTSRLRSNPSAKIQKPNSRYAGNPAFEWRRGWDSNPRYLAAR